eukprot:scaffold3976_cov45-Cyclotella_meneghiniana.AAC.18
MEEVPGQRHVHVVNQDRRKLSPHLKNLSKIPPNEAPHPNIIARIEALNEEWRQCEQDRGLIKGFLAGRKKRKAVEISPEANEVFAPPPTHIMPGSEGFSENDINQMLTSYADDGDDDDWAGVMAAV